MPQTRIWIHAVWSTKKRIPFLTDDIRSMVFEQMAIIGAAKNIYIDRVNGYTDHVHCLIRLHPGQQLAEVVRVIKGASSYWINVNNLTSRKFRWQKEYYAISVSESVVPVVQAYIDRQEERHRRQDYGDEEEELKRVGGLD